MPKKRPPAKDGSNGSAKARRFFKRVTATITLSSWDLLKAECDLRYRATAMRTPLGNIISEALAFYLPLQQPNESAPTQQQAAAAGDRHPTLKPVQ